MRGMEIKYQNNFMTPVIEIMIQIWVDICFKMAAYV